MQLTNVNSYTGGTWLTGGTTTLIDQGTLTNTTSIELDYAGLSINNTGTMDLSNRVADGAPITMKGGALGFAGRAQTASFESLGAVAASQGLNTITVNAGGTGVNSATLRLANLTVSNDAVVNFASSGTLGQIGSSPQILVTAYTGNIAFLGGWAVVNGAEFAGYNSALGVGALNATGFAGYDATSLTAASTSTENIRLTATQNFPSVAGVPMTLTVNSLNMTGVIDLNFANSGDILNLVSGGAAEKRSRGGFHRRAYAEQWQPDRRWIAEYGCRRPLSLQQPELADRRFGSY